MTTRTDDPLRYVVETSRSVNETQEAVTAVARGHAFGVLHVYDMKQTLKGKGFELEPEVRVLELCSPSHAHQVLKTQVDMNLALPCRISIWQEGGVTNIGMIRPKAMLEMLTEDAVLRVVADEVEGAMVAIIDEVSGLPTT